MILNSTEKFTGKAEVYSAARPGYPNELIDYLYTDVGLSRTSVIADIGSGTGKFSINLLKRGSDVYCVEPNDDMRSIADRDLSIYPNFHSINGVSECTGLNENSVDFITVAQAFHWFDADKFKEESRRILKRNGSVILVWNMRTDSEFTDANRAIFEKYCPEFRGFSSEKRDRAGVEYFFDGKYKQLRFASPYYLDRASFIARSESGSYSLSSSSSNYDEYIQALYDFFDKYEVNGIIEIPSETVAYIGKIN